MPKWTNRSVIALSGELNPITEVTRRAREVVLAAMEEGWTGPPYDPFALADFLGIPTVASDDVPDARVGYEDGHFMVEYSPHKPRARTETYLSDLARSMEDKRTIAEIRYEKLLVDNVAQGKSDPKDG